MPNLHKVLIVGHGDRSMEPAYEIISCLREFGYSTDLCHINDDDSPSNIKAIQVLNGDVGLSGYEGVIFLDDGGDPEAAMELAQKAAESKLVVAGHGEGMLILSTAGLLEDKYICHGLDEKQCEGAKVVDSPSVRDDKIVSSIEGCATGFAILLVDALGGKIKNIVRAKGSIPIRSALIVAPISTWADFWPLAKEMRSRGSWVVISDWDSIDVGSGRLRNCAYLDVDSNDIKLMSDQPLPRSIWFRDTSLSPKGTIDAVARLEEAGCVNVNSSASMHQLMDEKTVALLSRISGRSFEVFDGDSLDQAVKKLVSQGTWTASSVPRSARKAALKVRGQSGRVVISRKSSCGLRHVLTGTKDLKKALASAFNRNGFVVRQDGGPRLGDNRFELLWVMRRGPDGWRASQRLAKSEKITCYATEVIRLIFPDEWKEVLEDADAVAEIISIVLQSIIPNQDDLSEMGLVMMLDGSEPVVTDIKTVVGPELESAARYGGAALRKLANALCLPHDGTQPPTSNGAEDLASALDVRAGDPVHRRIIERELAHEDIWIQPSGMIAMQTCGGIEKLRGLDDLVSKLRGNAIKSVQEEIEKTQESNEVGSRMASKASKRARHRLRLAMEMLFLTTGDRERVKLAGIYPSSIAGPFAHLELPLQERVFSWNEGDDWLTDREKAVSDLVRYNPEYEKVTMSDDEGFYFVWDEQNRSPTDWLNVLQGDTIYKTRNLLSPGKMY